MSTYLLNNKQKLEKINLLTHEIMQVSERIDDSIPLNILVSRMFPSASFSSNHIPDCFTISRLKTKDIFVKIFNNFERNMNKSEVDLFLNSVNESSVLISKHSGIETKSNFQIDILDNMNIVVYLYGMNGLPTAINMIDSLSSKLDSAIPKEVQEEMNREYQQYVLQKSSMIQLLKEQYKSILSKMEEIQFPSLDKYLSSLSSASFMKRGHICDICNVFDVATLKGLAAHKRGCARKHIKNEI
jgi:hypothetical protein